MLLSVNTDGGGECWPPGVPRSLQKLSGLMCPAHLATLLLCVGCGDGDRGRPHFRTGGRNGEWKWTWQSLSKRHMLERVKMALSW